jgi:hypothetical protein
VSVYTVEVGVALRRPPRTDQHRKYVIEAENGHTAELVATQWAGSSPGVVMAVSSLVTDWEEGSA